MRYFDIAVNLLDRRFAADRDEVLARASDAGVEHILVLGSDAAQSTAAQALCMQTPAQLSCAVGIHPHHAAQATAADFRQLRRLAGLPQVRAIGEAGLDYARDLAPRSTQLAVLDAQFAIAAETGLPMYLHDRDTDGALVAALAPWRSRLAGVVVHCFTGSADELAALLALDCYVGITGWVCDERRGDGLAALVRRIPRDRLLIETDAPYLVPRTLRPRPRRCEPRHVVEIARQIAALRGESLAAVAAATWANANRLFGDVTALA